jgi:glycosyltransferase involved in cell wall biosynthesis
MNILHVTPFWSPAAHFGGVVRSVGVLASQLAARGHRVAVATTAMGTPHESCREPIWQTLEGVNVCYCPAIHTPAGVLARDMTNVVRHPPFPIDVLHVTGVWQPSCLMPARVAHRMELPYITSPRGALCDESFAKGAWKKYLYYRLFERAIQNQAATIHATSPLEQEELHALGLRPPIETIPNMVSPATWRRDPDAGKAWRENAGIGDREFVILYVGRISPEKNLPFLTRSLGLLPHHPTWRFVTIGAVRGDELARLLAAAPPTIRHRITSLPACDDDETLRAAYNAADVVVCPSIHENFSNVIVEAAMCGIPTIASPFVGAALMTAELGCTVLVPLDETQWATILSERMTSRHQPPVVADARACLINTFAPDAVIDHFERLYSRVAGKPESSAMRPSR